jgi:hypothetical protein
LKNQLENVLILDIRMLIECLLICFFLVKNSSKQTRHYFKFTANQGFPEDSNDSGTWLKDGEDVSEDLEEVARYLKLTVNQRYSPGQCNDEICL